MSEENKYMDDSFKKMSEDFKVTYNSSYWAEMESQLNDEFLDDAFKTAAASSFVVPEIPDLGDISADLDNAFMDEAFKSAAAQQQTAYSSAYWTDFTEQEPNLQMNDAFTEASKATVADYNPDFWNDADVALQKEGLHYEYKSAYWDEAKTLLDLADRRQFFARWSAVATILLLISFVGINTVGDKNEYFVEGHDGANTIATLDVQSSSAEISTAETSYDLLLSTFDAGLSLNASAENGENVYSEAFGQNDLAANSTNHTSSNEGENIATSSANSQTAGVENENLTETVQNQSPQQYSSQGNEVVGGTTSINGNTEEINHTEQNALADFADPSIKFDALFPRPENRFLNANENLKNLALKQDMEVDYEMDVVHNIRKKAPPVIETIDYVEIAEAPEAVTIERYKPRPTHQIALYGGFGFGNEYSASFIEPAYRTNLGLEYMHLSYGKLSRFEFGASFGVNHIRQNTLGKTKRVIDYTYTGTSTAYFYKVHYKEIFHLNGNLRVNYKIAPRHKFLFGVGYEHLLAVQTNMSYFNRGDEELTIVNDNWGVKDGMALNDIRFSFGYQYDLSSRLSVNLTGNLGMRDRTDNEFFENDIIDQEYSLILGLKYNLFRK
ncbi:MAG: hypothetical protein MI810_06760 [Flavobacteriales bacterium]|nr:hypothetical protein [Flavobacteriales bacterium]